MDILETIGFIASLFVAVLCVLFVLFVLHMNGYEKGVASYNEAIAKCEETLPRTQTCHMVAVVKPEEE